jgi:C4-dicarboxylate-specific signal transduction histidine kinase/ABC-type phosphate/phosphonate transport system substrate-binding protein
VVIHALLLCLVAGLVLPRFALAQADMSIGVLAFRGKQDAIERWLPTARYLSERITDYRFEIVPLTLEGMLDQVEQNRLDFILTNTGNYVVLENAFGISRLATLKVRHLGAEFTQFGAVIFTRQDNTELNALADVAGHSMLAVSEEAFGGFQMAWRELLDAGIDPFEDLRLKFGGFPQDDIVHAVLAGEVDVGTVRSGTLERMAADGLIELDRIKVLGARQSDVFPFLHSTRLYPEWPFAKARGTPEKLAQRVAVALLELEPDSEAALRAYSAGWTIPLDYGPVHELFRELEIGPYAYLGKPSLTSVWREYKGWIIFSLAMMLLLVALLILISRANRRISQSELKYRAEANQRRLAQELLARHKEELEERVAERTAELADVNASLRRSEATLRAIHDITSNAELRFEDKLAGLLREGCRFFEMETGLVVNTGGDNADTLARVDIETERAPVDCHRLVQSVREQIGISQAPVAVSDLRGHSFQGQEDLCGLAGSVLAADYLVDDEAAGIILFASSSASPREFSDVDIDILQLMAQWLGGEIERTEINRRAQAHQAQLAHVSRLNTMGEMATGIAHELNQPLTAILNYSGGSLRLLQKRGNGDSELHQAIVSIGNDARRAADIIKGLREFIQRGEHRRERFVLEDCIESAVELLRPRLLQHDIEVDIRRAEAVPEIVADRVQIEQVAVNLLINAIDAVCAGSQSPKKIEIGITRTDAGEVAVSVSDSGDLLSQSVIERLFDPFYTTKSDGMGMGLSISRSIVESHGGTIEYLVNEAQHPTFRFTLPVT